MASGDGSTTVGRGRSGSGIEAFRQTAAGGLVGLGDLPGGNFESIALAVSNEGSTTVGVSLPPRGSKPSATLP